MSATRPIRVALHERLERVSRRSRLLVSLRSRTDALRSCFSLKSWNRPKSTAKRLDRNMLGSLYRREYSRGFDSLHPLQSSYSPINKAIQLFFELFRSGIGN